MYGAINCFNCGGRGHVSKECPTPKANKPQGDKPQGEKPHSEKSNSKKKQWKQKGKFKNEKDVVEIGEKCGEVSRQIVDSLVAKVGNTMDSESAVVFLAETKGDWDSSMVWCVDSGATHHMTPHKGVFRTYMEFTQKVSVTVADRKVVEVCGSECMVIGACNSASWKDLGLDGVWHVLGIAQNLLFVPVLDKIRFHLLFGDGKCTISKNSIVYVVTLYSRGTYQLVANEYCGSTDNPKAFRTFLNLVLWHQCLGHPSPECLQQ